AHAVWGIRHSEFRTPLIATGGVRDGHMVAKALGLGASMAGIRLPLLKAALPSEQAVHELTGTFTRGLRTATIRCGAAGTDHLHERVRLSRRFLDEAELYR